MLTEKQFEILKKVLEKSGFELAFSYPFTTEEDEIGTETVVEDKTYPALVINLPSPSDVSYFIEPDGQVFTAGHEDEE